MVKRLNLDRIYLLMVFLFLIFVVRRISNGHPSGMEHTSNTAVKYKPVKRNPIDDAHLDYNMKVAFAITVTKDGPYLDGAAVLMQSIKETNPRVEYDFVAIIHPGVQSTREGLRKLGYTIHEFQPPIKSEEIRGQYLRTTIDKSGCCGALELLKLRGFQLTEYDRVLLLDLDAIFMKNIDHLFVRDSVGRSALFTYDYAMDTNSAAPPVQGGFILIKPDTQTYEEIIEIVREGNFVAGSGWAGSRIGWSWGGQTVQGVVSYYYNKVAAEGKGMEIDHCRYNGMATTHECRYMDFEDVYTGHFTWCQKPWECHKGHTDVCVGMHAHWWLMRNKFEAEHGLPKTTRCCRDTSICDGHSTYHAIRLDLL